MTGILIQNGDRPDIAFDNGTLYGGLHCGECFRLYDGEWLSARLEYDACWILLIDGQAVPVPYGSTVKL